MKKIVLFLLTSIVVVVTKAQNVGIGTNTPLAKLDVNAADNFVSRFNGPNQMYLGFFETGTLRGYLGSFSGATEDFDMGTSSGNATGKLHLTTTALPRMTIDAAGNVGIGTTSPSASSLLDMNSTTKGLLIPRMTTAQRTAIIAPANGLMVYDITTNSFWYYNSSAWTNMSGGGGGFTLPYAQIVNTGVHAFHITNQGTGAGLAATSTNEFGIGINVNATGGFGWGVNAFTNRPGATSIRSLADSGIVFHGENIYPGNTNRLMNLLNRGMGKTLHLQLSNTSNTTPNMEIAGNNLGEQLKIFQTNASNTLPAVSINNSGTGAGLYSVSTNGTGVAGAASGGVAVRGDAITGSGVVAYSTSGIGLNAGSISGTGIYANSISGLALNVVGNLKIAGGNTSPGNGKVLTSDASGNATWQAVPQEPKVGFRAYGVSSFSTAGTPNNSIPNATFKKVEFQTENYDSYTAFVPTGNFVATSGTSKFTSPFSGVYHFDAAVTSESNLIFNHYGHWIRLQLDRNGTVSTIAELLTRPTTIDGSTIQISTDFFLEADDIVWVEFKHFNLSLTSINLETSGIKAFFSGHLIYQQQ